MSFIIPYKNQDNISPVPDKTLELDLSYNNWPQQFPYSPKVQCRLWHNNNMLFLNFEIEEEYIAAKAIKDNEAVCKDSCVEFFISFDEGGYYNIEANCTGKILMSHREGRKINVKYAPKEVLSGIERNASLGTDTFECKKSEGKWFLTLAIPVSSFFKHDYKSLSGIKAKCNIYKCGDELPNPHFMSWQPIKTETPDFHRPEFFGTINFE